MSAPTIRIRVHAKHPVQGTTRGYTDEFIDVGAGYFRMDAGRFAEAVSKIAGGDAPAPRPDDQAEAGVLQPRVKFGVEAGVLQPRVKFGVEAGQQMRIRWRSRPKPRPRRPRVKFGSKTKMIAKLQLDRPRERAEELEKAKAARRERQQLLAQWVSERIVIGSELTQNYPAVLDDAIQWHEERGLKPPGKRLVSLAIKHAVVSRKQVRIDPSAPNRKIMIMTGLSLKGAVEVK